MKKQGITRRELLELTVALGASPLLASVAQAATGDENMMTRKIPASGEELPVIGLGTYDVFDVASTDDNIATRAEIVKRLTDHGGSLIDTSPMYNRSEKVIGDVIARDGNRDDVFLATKVWIDGEDAGIRQMNESAKLMQTKVIDLMQVHNLRDTDIHMATIREWQEEGRIRYNGLTHYTAGAHAALESSMRTHKPDFIQINYSIGEREAGNRVLPAAEELGIAVLANRPFVTGRLFSKVSGMNLPGWATEFADSWGQFFLKYITSHPAVTCVIPATSKPKHMLDNLGAGFGPVPDAATRRKMEEFFDDL